jgi:D-3-phosphoglycerate dehydrogenase / 2-oxoglutarate reductase
LWGGGSPVDKIKVVVTDYVEPDLNWEEEQARQLGIDFQYYQSKNASENELIRICSDADIVVVNMANFNQNVIQGLKKTRLIIRHGIGYDNVDVPAVTEHGIMFGYIPDYCVAEVAEQALMLMFACQRKLVTQLNILDQSVKSQRWEFQSINPIYRLSGKTVGIVGLGRIGGTVFRMLQGMNVKILVCDPYLSEARKREYEISTIPLEELLPAADIVTIHCPLNYEDTYHMFDAPQFKQMKKSAILINTARGGIVNLKALDQALRDGELAMAGIDVYEKEPPAQDFPLLSNPKAICAPHLSWLSEESSWNIREKIIQDIRRYCEGLPPVHQLNQGQVDFPAPGR